MKHARSGFGAETAFVHSIGEMPLWDIVVKPDAIISDIEKIFLNDANIPACIIKDGDTILGLLSQKALIAALAKPYARELLVKRSLQSLLNIELVETNPLILPTDTSISKAVELALARDSSIEYEPILVDDGKSCRILEVDVLMRIQSKMLHQMVSDKDQLIDEVQKNADELRKMMLDLEKTRDRLIKSEERLEGEVAKRTLELEKINLNLVEKQNQIDEELKIARTLQQSILPEMFPKHPCYDGHAYMRAARMVGGDFYDMFSLDAHRIGIVVADISGKGVPAALFMVLIRTILQEVALRGLSPSACLAETNTRLAERNPLSLFVTVVYGILDTQSGIFTFANGGHIMPYILRADGGIETIKERASPLVGLIDTATYQDINIKLEPNDGLLLITDGITECFNFNEEVFGEKRLIDFFTNTHHRSIKELIHDLTTTLDRFSNGIPPSDDVTALIFRYFGNSKTNG